MSKVTYNIDSLCEIFKDYSDKFIKWDRENKEKYPDRTEYPFFDLNEALRVMCEEIKRLSDARN